MKIIKGVKNKKEKGSGTKLQQKTLRNKDNPNCNKIILWELKFFSLQKQLWPSNKNLKKIS